MGCKSLEGRWDANHKSRGMEKVAIYRWNNECERLKHKFKSIGELEDLKTSI